MTRHMIICCMAEEFFHTSVFPLKSAPFQAVFSCSFCGWTHLHLRCVAWHTYERGPKGMSTQASRCFPVPLLLERCRRSGGCRGHPAVGSPLQEIPKCQRLTVQACNAPRLSWGCLTALPMVQAVASEPETFHWPSWHHRCSCAPGRLELGLVRVWNSTG